MRIVTKRKATIGVCTVLQRYRELKSGDFSKTVSWTVVIWVSCNEDEYHDISNAGPLHEKLSRRAEADARKKYPRSKGWWVSASESWGVNPNR